MRELVSNLDKRNIEYARDLGETYEPVQVFEDSTELRSDQIVMIDLKTEKRLSPQMREIFSLIDTWPDAFYGKTIVSPGHIVPLLTTPDAFDALAYLQRDFAPFPPGGADDAKRTSIFAYEPQELWFTLLWWDDDKDEPHLLDFDGGGVAVYEDISDLLQTFAFGHSESEAGQAIERKIRNSRGMS